MNKRAVGENYEQMAARYLQSQGARIVECNFHSRRGEIDLIMWESGYLVFVEVKYRRSEKAGNPAEAVTLQKQRRICQTAQYYLYTRHIPQNTPVRYDVVAICGDEITWHRNAFEHMW